MSSMKYVPGWRGDEIETFLPRLKWIILGLGYIYWIVYSKYPF